MLHPEVVLRSDVPKMEGHHGAARVARMALGVARRSATLFPVLVNGTAGSVGRAALVMAFTVSGGRVVEIDVVAGAERLRGIDLAAFTG